MTKRIVAITLLSVMLLAVLSGCFQRNDDNGVVAVFDGREITQAEFNKYLYASDTLYTNNKDFTAEEKNQFLEYFINEELFYAEAVRQGVEVSEELVDEEYDEYRTAILQLYFNNSESEFSSRMKSLNLTEEYLKDEVIAKNLVIADFIEQLQSDVEPVSQTEVNNFYEENLEEQFTRRREERTVRHLLVESESVAEALLKRIQEGESFGELAKEHSIDGTAARGGILDPAEKSEYVEPFAEAAFNLRVGEVSDVVQTQYGYHIIEVLAIHQPGVVPLDFVRPSTDLELREEISIFLDNQNKQKVVVELINQLRDDANVEKMLD